MTEYSFTPEQMARAEARYKADVKRMYAEGYTGDFGTSFEFAMQTYGPVCWLKYFQDEP